MLVPVSNLKTCHLQNQNSDRQINTRTESDYYVYPQEGNRLLTRKTPNSEYCPDDLYHSKLERVTAKSK